MKIVTADPVRLITATDVPVTLKSLRQASKVWDYSKEEYEERDGEVRIRLVGQDVEISVVRLSPPDAKALLAELAGPQSEWTFAHPTVGDFLRNAAAVWQVQASGDERVLGFVAGRVSSALQRLANGGTLVADDSVLLDAGGNEIGWPKGHDPRSRHLDELPEEARAVRLESLKVVEALGFPYPPLPYIGIEQPRSAKEVATRALLLHELSQIPVVGGRRKLLRRLDALYLREALTDSELRFLRSLWPPFGNPFWNVADPLSVLLWALGRASLPGWGMPAELSGTHALPRLGTPEATRFLEDARLRPQQQIAQAHDVVYCLTWGVRDRGLRGQPPPGRLPGAVYWERRRAFEWLNGDDWDEPDAST